MRTCPYNRPDRWAVGNAGSMLKGPLTTLPWVLLSRCDGPVPLRCLHPTALHSRSIKLALRASGPYLLRACQGPFAVGTCSSAGPQPTTNGWPCPAPTKRCQRLRPSTSAGRPGWPDSSQTNRSLNRSCRGNTGLGKVVKDRARKAGKRHRRSW